MNPARPEPAPAPEGQPSDSRTHNDPEKRDQATGSGAEKTDSQACQRALFLLESLHRHQEYLPRSAALSWERAAFSEVFDHPEPGLRIRRFLEKA
jgi:hypothetical protein